MKKSDFLQIIREAIYETTVKESSPPGFPEALHKKLVSKYGESPEAYATMWKIHQKMQEGNAKITGALATFKNKELSEEKESMFDQLHRAMSAAMRKKDPEAIVYYLNAMSEDPLPSAISSFETFKGSSVYGEWKRKNAEEIARQEAQIKRFSYLFEEGAGGADSQNNSNTLNATNHSDVKKTAQLNKFALREHGETDMSNPEERTEVDIGKAILKLCAKGSASIPHIEKLAKELIDIHNKKIEKAGNIDEDWDLMDMEIELNGKPYNVNVKFIWSDESDDEYNQSGYNGAIRTTRWSEATGIEKIEATDENDTVVKDANVLKTLGAKALGAEQDSGNHQKNHSTGKWVPLR